MDCVLSCNAMPVKCSTFRLWGADSIMSYLVHAWPSHLSHTWDTMHNFFLSHDDSRTCRASNCACPSCSLAFWCCVSSYYWYIQVYMRLIVLFLWLTNVGFSIKCIMYGVALSDQYNFMQQIHQWTKWHQCWLHQCLQCCQHNCLKTAMLYHIISHVGKENCHLLAGKNFDLFISCTWSVQFFFNCNGVWCCEKVLCSAIF